MRPLKTNLGLVAYAETALAKGWGYVWGTYGLVMSETLLQAKIKQYPDMVGRYQTLIRQKWMNKRTADCIGLIKAYLWDAGSGIAYDAKTDVNVGGMVNAAKEKGKIETLPEIAGVCVYKQGHIGIYIGSGQVIEAYSTSLGVIKTPLRGAGWTGWLKVPYIEYPAKELTLEEAIDYLAKGNYVDSPDYWKQNAQKGKSVPGDIAAFVIKKWAKSLMG